MLPANEQEVIWVDGLSIELNQLSPELEPVGICVAINANKAIVRYKEEFNDFRWADSARFEIDDNHLDTLISEDQIVNITINGKVQSPAFSFVDVSSRQNFVDELNKWFRDKAKSDQWFSRYSAELVELDTDLPATDTSDDKDGDSYRNRVIINLPFHNGSIAIGTVNCTIATAKHIKSPIFCMFLNNGFYFDSVEDYISPINRAKIFDFVIPDQDFIPDVPLDSINNDGLIVKKDDFENNEYCQILRDNFASYDDYIDSFLVKFPCGTGEIAKHPSGKENTYKLVDCKYTKLNGDQEYLYPAARKAASIDVNGPKLTAGNWWLPSSAEMTQMMRDITYGTNSWDKVNINNNTDIVNRVIDKMRSVDTKWVYLSASTLRWTSSRYDENGAYCYSASGDLGETLFWLNALMVTPITIYEF